MPVTSRRAILALVLLALAPIAGLGAKPSPALPASRSNKPVGFEPAAVSFISASRGWALGRADCANCAGLRVTRDGGARWSALPSPRVPLSFYSSASRAVTDIAFGDAANGFLFGPGLLITHDGGRTWQRQSLPPIDTLIVGAGYAYALTQARTGAGVSLLRAAVGSDRWTRLSLPAVGTGALRLAVEDHTVVLLHAGSNGPAVKRSMRGRIWLSSDSGTNWRARAVPCTPAEGGATVVAISRAHRDSAIVDCFDNEQSSQEQDTQHHLYRTTNTGNSWARMGDPTRHNLPATLADNGANHIFLATDGVRDTLVGSFDGGRHWRQLLRSGGSFFGWADLRFVTATTGFVVGPTHYATEHIYRTDDGGRSWRILQIG
jgi:photosystem II stability/assembly factor-like uncharacterized protein